MASRPYDAIVIGARCAGSPTAMLLARKGARVLLVDRDTFPSDTISTHLIHPPGMAALRRWGLHDAVTAVSAPIDTYAFDFGPVVLAGAPGTPDEPYAYAPRRTQLDAFLVDAAAAAGAEVRQGFTVDELVFENDRVVGIRGRGTSGGTVEERAAYVVGADGRNSSVARAVKAETYHEKPPILQAYYSYWSGLPMNGRFETYARPGHGFAAWPVTRDITLIVAGWPVAELDRVRKDVETEQRKTMELVPAFAERFRAAKREERFLGTSVPNYFRKPFGPGWALAGDAAYNKDFITAFGITDAFRDAEHVAGAIGGALGGGTPFETAMAAWQAERDQHALPYYEFTTTIARLEPPPPQMQQVFGAVAGNPEALDQFAKMNAELLSPAEFFSEQNLGKIFAAASARSH